MKNYKNLFLGLIRQVFLVQACLATVGSISCMQKLEAVDGCELFASEEVIQRIDRYVDCIVNASYCESLAEITTMFKYERVHNGFQEIKEGRSLRSLQKTWQDIKTNTSNTLDHCEVGEFSVLLIIVYSSVIKHHAEINGAKKVNWLSVISLYAQLNMIPLGKLFDVLDECWKRYQEIMNMFPKTDDQSWLEWSQDYWWVPITLIAFTAFSYLRWSRTKTKVIV